MNSNQNGTSLHSKEVTPCVVVGSSFSDETVEDWNRITLSTPFGIGEIFQKEYNGKQIFMQFRHGIPHTHLPHQINFQAQAWMWKEMHIDVLLLTSIPCNKPMRHSSFQHME